jgi:hypothetical protein
VVAAETLVSRIEAGSAYLSSLTHPRWKGWESAYAEFQQGGLSQTEALTLAHPHWRSPEITEAVQGPRAFEPTEMVQGWPCQAERIWGYRCEVSTDGRPCLDHVFPYGLGGPTVSENRLTLCEAHNRAKAGDIHLFPWEEGEPPWLAPLLERIVRLR